MGDTQWEKLTGDADLVRIKGDAYTKIADAISRATRTLQNIVDDTNTTAKSMEKTRELANDVREDIKKATDRYRVAGQALSAYAPILDTAISESETAADTLSRLRADLATAHATQRTAKSNVDDLPVDASEVDARSAGANLRNANNEVSRIQGDITYWESRWHDAKGDKDRAARTARHQIDEVVSGAKVHGLKDGFWDKVGDVAAKAWDAFYKWAKIVCDIASILAIFLSWVPILGEVLLALAAIGAILAIIDAAQKYARGKISFRGMLVGVGIGLLSLVGGKAAVYLAKVAKAKTVMTALAGSKNALNVDRAGKLMTAIGKGQASRKVVKLAQKLSTDGDDGLKLINKSLKPLAEGRLTLKDALKTPFVRSESQREVAEAFAKREPGLKNLVTASGKAQLSTLKNAFPKPFKDGVTGVLLRDANDLTKMSRAGLALQAPARIAATLSVASVGGDVVKGVNGVYEAFALDGKTPGDKATSFVGVVGPHVGGSWNTALGAPNTLFNDLVKVGAIG